MQFEFKLGNENIKYKMWKIIELQLQQVALGL